MQSTRLDAAATGEHMSGTKPKQAPQVVELKHVVPTKNQLLSAVPLISTIQKYEWRTNAMDDLVAGLTTGVMLIPQGMAYALLANLPPQYGLFTATMPIIMYALFGTSHSLAIGPVAIISLLVAEAIEPPSIVDGVAQTTEQMEEYKIQLASVLAFLVGAMSIAMAVFRAGQLSTFLSHSVLVGFTAGAAAIIAISQLKHVLGYSIPKSHYPVVSVYYMLKQLPDTNVTTLVCGLVGIVFLLISRHVKKRFGKPVKGAGAVANWVRKLLGLVCSLAALQAIIGGTLIAQYLYQSHGHTTSSLPIVGSVPAGLPSPTVPSFKTLGTNATNLIITAFVITMLAFMESFAVADLYARKHGYTINATQELIGIGFANLIGSFFHSYPAAGGFGRTAVNDSSGATSQLASLISAAIIFVVCSSLTSLVYYLPKAILGSIVLVAVSNLIDFHAFGLSWRIAKRDFWIMAITCVVTICVGTELGLAVGVIMSVLGLLQGAAYPHTAVLGAVTSQDTDQTYWRNLARFSTAQEPAGVVVFRFDASLQFINCTRIMAKLHEAIAAKDFDAAETGPYHKGVILDWHGVHALDIAGIDALIELQKSLHAKQISLVAAHVIGPVRDTFDTVNEYRATQGEAPLLQWIKQGDQDAPISAMVASIDEGLKLLTKMTSNDVEAQLDAVNASG